jgi:hypothetical protein
MKTGGAGSLEGLAAVKIGAKWGYIDNTGKLVIEPQFEFADAFNQGLGLTHAWGEVAYIDQTGKFAATSYEERGRSPYLLTQEDKNLLLNCPNGYTTDEHTLAVHCNDKPIDVRIVP